MAEKHPYVSGSGAITAAVTQFRKSFPSKVTADTLRKLGIAPNNESYVINTLRFIKAIDNEGNKTDEANAVFNKHGDADFQPAFGKLIQTAYNELFSLHGEDMWNLTTDQLISFFRNSDQTSEVVGRRQASTFQALASLAGHGEMPVMPKASGKPKEARARKAKTAPAIAQKTVSQPPPGLGGPTGEQRDFGLTVRVEVNLPAGGDQDTYDRIFRSIRENLLNAK